MLATSSQNYTMITNFFRIELPFESFQIQRTSYSNEKLDRLKKAHNRECSFFRHGEYIYASPKKGCELELGELATLKVSEHTNVVLSLIRHLVFRMFRESFPERIPQSFSPLRFFSTKSEHDPLRKLLPPALQDVIAYPRMIEVEARSIIEHGYPTFGLLIRSRQRWQFKLTLENLIADGYNLIGKTVLETQPIPGLEGILAPDESLLGEVIEVSDEEAVIQTNEGTVRKKLQSLQLQRSRHQIGDYLEFQLGEVKATQLFKSLQHGRQEQQGASASLAEAQKVASWFAGSNAEPRLYENNDGFCFTVSLHNTFEGSSIHLHTTNLIFDFGPGASATTPLTGLKNFGPFNAAKFERNDLRLLAFCRPQSRGAMTEFIGKLIEGIPDSKYFQRGLRSLFHLNSIKVDVRELKSSLPEAYEEAIDEAVKNFDQRGVDLALVECPELSVQPPIRENSYYRARAKLMAYGIPTQGVRSEHLRRTSGALEWTLGPMALQIYAKVGGTPWRLPASQSVDKEILIGVGNALDRPNLWAGAEQSRIVGITTFFLGDGSYVLGERLRSVPYESYFDELLRALKASIEHLADEYAWKTGSSVRIVFHIYKPIKNVEADVVSRLIDEFPQFKILFAFVTISTEHPWMMYRDLGEQRGISSVALCERGDNLVLDEHHALLQIRGDKNRPNRRQRPPFPVSIRLHERSTYKDLKYIMQQINDFAFLSWRSFFPAELPVTVFYSNLIASETSTLSKIPGWNPGFIDKHFRRKQWFL